MFHYFVQKLQQRCPQADTLWGLALSSLLINLLALMMPLVLLQTYDRVIPNQSFGTLAMLILAVGIALLFEVILKIIRGVIGAWADTRYEHRTSTHAFQHILQADPKAYSELGGGKLLDKLSAIGALKDFYTGQLLLTFIDIPFVVVFLILMAYLAGYLVLIPIVVVAIYFVVLLKSSLALREEVEFRQATDEKRMNFIIQILTKIHAVKSNAMEATMLRRYERLQEQTAAADHSLAIHNGKKTAVSQFASQITLVLTVSVGAILVIHNLISVGSLAACIFLANRVLQPVGRLSSMWVRLQTVNLSEERVASIFDIPTEHTQGQLPLENFNGKIQLKNLSFAFDGADPLLNNISLTLNAGDSVSISGASLSGKSTLLQLMQGMLAPTSGTIEVNGQLISSYEPLSLRSQVRYISHNAILYQGTLMENLTLFRGGDAIDKAKVYARALKLERFFHRLPKGYETLIGQSSAAILPEGIRQRIAIVRALVAEPKVLLFDEANTAMDLEADQCLKQLLASMKGKLTMVIASHRPSILKVAERQFSLEDGRLHELHS